MTYVTVDVNIDDFHSDDLIEELESRGYVIDSEADLQDPRDFKSQLEKIWQLRRTNQSYDHLMDDLIDLTLGKVI